MRTIPKCLSLTVQYACNADGLPTRGKLRRWVKAALVASHVEFGGCLPRGLPSGRRSGFSPTFRAEARPTEEAFHGDCLLTCDAEVTLRFVDAEEGRGLNRRYRGKDHPTNVLSFAYDPPPHMTGDLVLCVPVVLQEATRQGKPISAHFAHLVVHGILHLQGYTHELDSAAALMEAKESEILARLGVPDPY